MKKFHKIIILTLLVLSSLHSQAQNIIIKFNIQGIKGNSPKAIVNYVNGNQVLPADTIAISKKGDFTFTNTETSQRLYLVHVVGYEHSIIHIMVEPDDKIDIQLTFIDSINYFKITSAKGSRNVQLYQQFNNILCRYQEQIKPLDSEFNRADESRNVSDNELKRNEERKQEISLQINRLITSQNVEVRHLLEANSDVLMSAFIVSFFDNESETYADLFESIEKGLKNKYPGNQFVNYVSGKVTSNLGPGRMAPEIEMSDPAGKTRRLSDLRGKVVLIDFWASWCRPCRAENPNVVRLYKKYNSKGFEIFSVSLDYTQDKWVAAINDDGLVWPNHVSDLRGWTSSGGASYGIKSVPSTVLVDRQGRIIARNLRGEQLANKLKEIFGE